MNPYKTVLPAGVLVFATSAAAVLKFQDKIELSWWWVIGFGSLVPTVLMAYRVYLIVLYFVPHYLDEKIEEKTKMSNESGGFFGSDSADINTDEFVRIPLQLLEAVAHIGVDFGYGPYEIEEEHINLARRIHKAATQPQPN